MRFPANLLETLLIFVTLFIGWLAGLGGDRRGQWADPRQEAHGAARHSCGQSRPVGFGPMLFMRGIVAGFIAYFAIVFTFGILLIMSLWDKRNQNIRDKVSAT